MIKFSKRLRTYLFWTIFLQMLACILLVFWWGYLLLPHYSVSMIVLEGGWFLAILLLSSVFVAYLYGQEKQTFERTRTFFASFSHHLKTPLTSIRLQAESIEDCTSIDEMRPLLARLIQDTDRLEKQLDRSLLLAIFQTQPPPERLQTVALHEILQQQTQALAQLHRDKALIRFHGETEATVYADAASLECIFSNLVENSIAHGKQDKIQIDIGMEVTQDRVLVTYRDSGEGLGTDVPFRHVFKPFFKSKQSRGSGLGLYLVKEVAKRCRAEVRMGSSHQTNVNKGFCMELVFPKASLTKG